MNIIHLVRATTWGGGERYAFDLCRASVEAGHNVVVATRGKETVDGRLRKTGARLERLPLGGVLDHISPLRLARIIREMPGKEVVVHVHTFKDAEIAARTRIFLRKGKKMRIVCTRHLVKKGKRSWRWNHIFRNIDCLVFVSELARNVFMEGRPNMDPERIRVVHNSIIPPVESLSDIPSRESEGSAEINILFTGRLSPEKGIETLISALAQLQGMSMRLRIAGTGKEEYEASLRELAKGKGVADKIEWLGFVPDVYSEIRRADLCVAPSVARESFGLTIIEFMSQGKPVITTDNGAQKEIITDGTDGLLIPPGDKRRLAEAITILAENASYRKRLGKNALHTFTERFTFPIFFEKIMRIYKGAP